MEWLSQVLRFLAAMAASLVPSRHWDRVPPDLPIERGAFASGVLTWMIGLAIGIHGFLAHAHRTTSLGIDAMLHRTFTDPAAGYSQGMVQGFSGLSIFTFLLLTPAGWLTLYLVGTGGLRGIAAWFEDTIGDPVLTGIDAVVSGRWTRRTARKAIEAREALEGPEVADRVVSPAAAGVPDCDCERTINGRLRTVYPLKEHADLKVVRRSVRYDRPPDFTR